MVLSVDEKKKIVQMFCTKQNDCGSSEVQIALLSAHISSVTKHIQQNKKDKHTRLGLLKMVAQRRKLLHYLKHRKHSRYLVLREKLALKG